ncbi:MAG: prohibitin family protein [Candidatus Moranbacteria bacterium]|nr:prohibitin family protein [Candidatus Moranbacteria bacterium]
MKFLFWVILIFYVIPWALAYVKKMKSRDPNVIHASQKSPFDFLKKFVNGSGAQFSTSNSNNSNNNSKNSMEILKRKVLMIVGVIVAIIVAVNIIVIIPAGYTGVQTLFGKVKDKELSSGMHIVNPFVAIEKMSIRTEEYTMSVVQGEGQRVGADQIQALTKEGLTIDLDITVFHHLIEDRASDVYKDLGSNFQEKIIRPEIRSAIREVIAGYDAKAVYSEKRGEVATAIKDRLIETVEPRGIIVEQVLLRNVTLPAKLSGSIQEKLQAEQESQRYDFLLEKEKKEADRKRIEAEGQRDAQKIIDESLTENYLEYLYIRELKDRQGTIYVPTGSNGLPLFKSVQ